MKKRNLNIIVSIIISIITSSLVIPVQISGGIADVIFYGKSDIFTVLFNINNSVCYDCYNYKVLWIAFIIEIILIFIISLIILNFIDKRRKNNE